ncbi:uncharacterized protein LOC144167028 isoform X2 [Haemaphysalis longicornis]
MSPWAAKHVRPALALRDSSTPGASAQGLSSPFLPPTRVLDVAFVETPSPIQVLGRCTPSPRKVADYKNSPPEERTPHEQPAFKSRPSEGVSVGVQQDQIGGGDGPQDG